MKRLFLLLIGAMLSVTLMAQSSSADKIVGTWKAIQNGVTSKVSITKKGNGYQAQVIWVDNLKKEDGSIRTDEKNPDKSKRNTPANKIILIESVTYNQSDKIWDNGTVYDPTKGKTYKVELSLKDADKTLCVKGKWGPFSQTVYWSRLQ